MGIQCLIVVMSSLSVAADAPKDDAKKDLDHLQGNWVATSAESAGQAMPDETVKSMKFTIKGNKYTYTMGDSYKEEGTLKLDPTKKPKTATITITEGNDKGETQLGIYQLDRDTLKFCFARPGKDKERPKEFSTNADNEQLVLVFKREKS
jgi:uncharacterized protein (TIGR03067 family)